MMTARQLTHQEDDDILGKVELVELDYNVIVHVGEYPVTNSTTWVKEARCWSALDSIEEEIAVEEIQNMSKYL